MLDLRRRIGTQIRADRCAIGLMGFQMTALSLDLATGALPKSEPDGAIRAASRSPPDELLNHALELSAGLEARETDIAAWGEFLAPQPKSLAMQAERIMAQGRRARDAAADTLRAFLSQHGIAPQELEEHRPIWLASRRAPDAMAPPAFARTLVLSLEVRKDNWRFIAAHVPGLIAPRVLQGALALADALLAAEARLTRLQRPHVRRQYAIMAGWARRRRKWAVAARDAAEGNLCDYLERSGMHDRMRLALDYLMAWKRTLDNAPRGTTISAKRAVLSQYWLGRRSSA